MRWPLRHQIIGPLLIVAVASLVAVGAINARLAANLTRDRIERQLRGVAGVLTTSNFPLTNSVLRKMRDLSSAEFVLADVAGRSLASTWTTESPKLPHDGLLRQAADLALGPSVAVAGRDYFHAAIELPARPGSTDSRVLHVLFPCDEYRRSLREAYVPPLVVGVLAVAAAAVAARLLAGRISRTTAQLGEEVQRLARGDFSPVALPPTDDEIRDLALAVNRTATMLSQYEQEVRRTEQMRTVARLGASLAHELRNAATGCRMAVDIHAESCLCGRETEALVVAKRQLQLMESQLQRFLRLGRRTVHADHRDVNIGRLIEDLLPLLRPAARHANIALEWHAPTEELIVRGDDDGLGQVALNLVLNAIEALHQQPASGAAPRRVVLEARTTPHANVELSVSDTGPGPPESTAIAIFDPFVTSKAEGAGLGLAVAKEIVEAHQGTIDWSRTDGVTRFRVTLPPTEKGAICA